MRNSIGLGDLAEKIINIITFGYGKTFAAQFIKSCKVVLAIAHLTDVTSDYSRCYLQTWDGATWTNHTQLANLYRDASLSKTTFDIAINDTIQGVRIYYNGGGSYIDKRVDLYTLEYYGFASNSTLIADSNTITLNDTENNLCIFADVELPTNTSILFDISDGSNQVLNCELGDLVDISTLNSGTATITFKLSSSDSSVSPKIYGYGAIVIRN
mgnify:CR=1 FL=1